jgi:hypothetical protein
MTTVVTPEVSMDTGDMTNHLVPVPVRRLVLTHLRIWRAQRGVLVGTLLALTVGLLAVVIAILVKDGRYTVASLGEQFVASTAFYAMIWLAVGAVAGAAPYRSRWAALVLVVAPRRVRWFATSFASVIVWAFGVTVLLAGLCIGATAGVLALDGQRPVVAVGILTHLVPVIASTLLNVMAGFMLGAAARAVTVPLIAGYALAPLAPLLRVRGTNVGRWIDLGAATESFATGKLGIAMVTVVCLWVVVPALVAIWRLRRSPVG